MRVIKTRSAAARSANARCCRASTRSAFARRQPLRRGLPALLGIALDHGWVREGAPARPRCTQPPRRRRQKSPGRRSSGHARRSPTRSSASRPAPASATTRSRRRGGRAVQRDAVPAHDRRSREEPGRAEGLHHPALGRATPRSCSRSPGTSRGTSTASRPNRLSRCGSPSAARTCRARPGYQDGIASRHRGPDLRIV